MKKYIGCAVCLFIASFLIGYITVCHMEFPIAEAKLSITESPNFLKLIYRNGSVCLFLILGMGIVTIPLGFYQGLQLGVMLALWIDSGNNIGSYALLTVPHCIFELPALFISIALGLKFFWLLVQYYQHKKINLKQILFEVRFWIFSVPVLLIIAALIESFVTGWLYNTSVLGRGML